MARAGALSPQETPPSLWPFLVAGEPASLPLSAYLALDDHDLMVALKGWVRHRDPILSDLSGRFLDRRLLKPVFRLPHARFELEPHRPAAEAILRRRGWDPAYYLLLDRAEDLAYDPYVAPTPDRRQRAILALDESGRPREISLLSDSIRTLSERTKIAVNVYAPEDCIAELRQLLAPAVD